MYRDGRGVDKNNREAVKWYRLAAEQGDAMAQLCLGAMYDDGGKGVPRNAPEAVKWYRLAAEQGDRTAQFNLGNMYADGDGVPQDHVLAHMWLNLSAAQGEQGAAERRDAVAKRMTSAQTAEAQKLAREWNRSRNDNVN
jgi:TPR repeat protein